MSNDLQMHRFTRTEVREAMLKELKAVVTFYLNPSYDNYADFQDEHQAIDDMMYTLWDDVVIEDTDDDDDDKSVWVDFEDPEAVERALDALDTQ